MAPPRTQPQLSTPRRRRRRRRLVARVGLVYVIRHDGGLRESTILKKMKLRKIVKFEEEEACVICQGDLYRRVVRRRGKKKIVVPILHNCGHNQFHAKCMKKWLKFKNSCPLCNAVALNVHI